MGGYAYSSRPRVWGCLSYSFPLGLKMTNDISSFQRRVTVWAVECFGLRELGFHKERSHRFLEEALELVQSTGISREDCFKLVDYVYNRQVGETKQEVGGVLVTLAVLCSVHGIDMDVAGEDELKRIWEKIDVIRTKQAAKRRDSALPGYAEEAKRDEEEELAKFSNKDPIEDPTSKSGLCKCYAFYQAPDVFPEHIRGADPLCKYYQGDVLGKGTLTTEPCTCGNWSGSHCRPAHCNRKHNSLNNSELVMELVRVIQATVADSTYYSNQPAGALVRLAFKLEQWVKTSK